MGSGDCGLLLLKDTVEIISPSFIGSTKLVTTSSALRILLSVLERNGHSTVSTESNTTSPNHMQVSEYFCWGVGKRMSSTYRDHGIQCLSPVQCEVYNLSQKKIRSIREDSLKSLQESLASNKDVQVVCKYFVSLPTEEVHHKYHPTKGVMELSQRVHTEVIAKIHKLGQLAQWSLYRGSKATKTPCKPLHVVWRFARSK